MQAFKQDREPMRYVARDDSLGAGSSAGFEMVFYRAIPSSDTKEGAFSVHVFHTKHWKPFMIRRFGQVQPAPFFRRPAMQWEPSAFPNGHAFAVRYACPQELLADEQRMLQGSSCAEQLLAELNAALRSQWPQLTKSAPCAETKTTQLNAA